MRNILSALSILIIASAWLLFKSQYSWDSVIAYSLICFSTIYLSPNKKNKLWNNKQQ